jgi:hypothetical protein
MCHLISMIIQHVLMWNRFKLVITFDYRMDQLSNGHSMYIPRVALSSSSSSSKSSSRLKEFANQKRRDNFETSGESESEGIYGSSIRNYDGGMRPHRNQMYLVHKAPKRGSHSTQSSSASSSNSNHSIYVRIRVLLINNELRLDFLKQ